MFDFEDDIEINFDEILSSSPPMKRTNSEPLTSEINKKAKNSTKINLNFSELQSESHETKENIVKIHEKCSVSPGAKKTVKFERTNSTPLENEVTSSKQTSKLNFTSLSKLNEPKSVNTVHDRKRKFPGPAGLLPEFSPLKPNRSTEADLKDELLTQTPQNECIWSRIRVDFNLKPSEIYLPDKYNISWVKKRVAMKKLLKQKAPFLVTFIQNIQIHSIKNPIVNLVLKDRTGTIHGTILHNVYEEYSRNLSVGSFLILKDVGVLTSNNEPYITITKNNLISIYEQGSDGISRINIQHVNLAEITEKIDEKSNENAKKREFPLIRNQSNVCDNFKKVLHQIKLTEPCRPSNSEISNIFDKNEELDDFFNSESVFSSTQIKTKQIEPKKMEGTPEIVNIFEDVDINDLLDDF